MIAGPGSAEEAAWTLREAWAGLKMFASDSLIPTLENMGDRFSFIANEASLWAKEIWSSIKEYIQPAIDIIKSLSEWLLAAGQTVADFLGIDTEKLKKKFEDLAPTGADVATGILTGIPGLLLKKGGERLFGKSVVGAEEAGRRRFYEENRQAQALLDVMSKEQKKSFGMLSGTQQEAVMLRMQASKAETVQGARQEINQQIKVELKSGGYSEQEARKLAGEIGKVTREENRKALKALTQRSEF